MDKEFIMATAKTAEQQILWSINKWEYMSWGIRQKSALEYEGMATLALRVSGAVHKGWVFISLNEGKDCYEVRLLNVARTKVKRTLDEVYCDNLGQVLDGLIERKAEWTDAQYKDKAARDSARKMGMEVIDVSKKPEPQPQDKKFEHTDKQGLKFVVELYTMGDVITLRVLSPDDTLLWHNEMTKDTWDEAKEVFERTKARILDENDEIHNRFKLNNNSEDKAMKLNLSNKNESGNAAKQQVNNNASEPIVKQVDVMGLMGALNRDGHAKLSDHVIEDAEAVEVKDEQAEEIESVNVGEVTLATIMPKMQAEPEPTKQEVAEAIVKAATTGEATTKPLGKHGTLVIASGGGEKAGKPKPETKAARYAVQLLPSKSGGVWPKLYGFRSEKEAKAVAEKMPSSVTTRWDYGVNGEGRETKTRHWYLSAGKRYCDVMQELADALNKGDRVAVANAAAKACGVYAGVVAENKSKNDADPKPKREKKQEAKANTDGTDKTDKPATPAATGYSKEDVAAMLRDVLAGKALPKEVAELMAA